MTGCRERASILLLPTIVCVVAKSKYYTKEKAMNTALGAVVTAAIECAVAISQRISSFNHGVSTSCTPGRKPIGASCHFFLGGGKSSVELKLWIAAQITKFLNGGGSFLPNPITLTLILTPSPHFFQRGGAPPIFY